MNGDSIEQLRAHLAAAARRRRWLKQRAGTLLWATGVAAAAVLLSYTGPRTWPLQLLFLGGATVATILYTWALLGP